MDLEYFHHRHQESLFNADNAACLQSRLAHLSLVAAYAAKIDQAENPDGRAALAAFEDQSQRIDRGTPAALQERGPSNEHERQ